MLSISVDLIRALKQHFTRIILCNSTGLNCQEIFDFVIADSRYHGNCSKMKIMLRWTLSKFTSHVIGSPLYFRCLWYWIDFPARNINQNSDPSCFSVPLRNYWKIDLETKNNIPHIIGSALQEYLCFWKWEIIKQ